MLSLLVIASSTPFNKLCDHILIEIVCICCFDFQGKVFDGDVRRKVTSFFYISVGFMMSEDPNLFINRLALLRFCSLSACKYAVKEDLTTMNQIHSP